MLTLIMEKYLDTWSGTELMFREVPGIISTYSSLTLIIIIITITIFIPKVSSPRQ